MRGVGQCAPAGTLLPCPASIGLRQQSVTSTLTAASAWERAQQRCTAPQAKRAAGMAASALDIEYYSTQGAAAGAPDSTATPGHSSMAFLPPTSIFNLEAHELNFQIKLAV